MKRLVPDFTSDATEQPVTHIALRREGRITMMFQSLISRVQSSARGMVDEIIASVARNSAIYVPFAIAGGFAIAAGAALAVRYLGPELGCLTIAAIFVLVGVTIHQIQKREASVRRAIHRDNANVKFSSRAKADILNIVTKAHEWSEANPLAASAIKAGAPVLLPLIARKLVRNALLVTIVGGAAWAASAYADQSGQR